MAAEKEKIIFEIALDLVKAKKSIDELKAALKEQNKAFEGAKVGSAAYKQAEANAKALKERIKELTDATKANTQSLGGVNQSAKFVKGSYGELEQSIKMAKDTMREAVRGTKEFEEAQKDFNKLITEKIEIDKKNNSLLKERITQGIVEANSIEGIKNKIESLISKSKGLDVTSKEFKNIQKEIKGASNQLGIAENRIDEFGKKVKSDSAEGKEAITKFTVGAAAGLSLMKSKFSDNEDAQKALAKAAQTFELIQSVRAITEGILAAKTAFTTIATYAQVTATYVSIAAQKAYQRALAASTGGLSLIITAIGALAAMLFLSDDAMASNTGEVEKNKEAFLKNNEGIKNYLKTRSELIKNIEELKINLSEEVGTLSSGEAERKRIISESVDSILELKRRQKAGELSVGDLIEKEREKMILKLSVVTAKENKEAEEKQKEHNEEMKKIRIEAFGELQRIAKEKAEQEKKINDEIFAEDLAEETKRIELEINKLKEGDEVRLNLRKQTLNSEMELQLNSAIQERINRGESIDELQIQSQRELNIIEEFNQKKKQAQDEHDKFVKDKLIKSKEEELNAKLLQLENDGLSTTAKEVEIENNKFETLKAQKIANGESIALITEQHEKNLTDIKKKEADNRAKVERAQFETSRNILSAYGSLVEIFASNDEDLAEFSKAMALFNIGIDTAQGISGIIKTVVTKDPDITGVSQALLITAQVASLLGGIEKAKKLITEKPKAPDIQKFDSGNIAFDGYIPSSGGMILGKSHSSGGVKFKMGNKVGEADGRKGEAYIINTAHDPFLRAAASAINVAGGGKAFYNSGGITTFQDGGFAARAITERSNISDELAAKIAEQFMKLPAPVVIVEDISAGQERMARIEERASL